MNTFKNYINYNLANEVTEHTIACRILPDLYMENHGDIVLRHDHSGTKTVTSLESPKSQRGLGGFFF